MRAIRRQVLGWILCGLSSVIGMARPQGAALLARAVSSQALRRPSVVGRTRRPWISSRRSLRSMRIRTCSRPVRARCAIATDRHWSLMATEYHG